MTKTNFGKKLPKKIERELDQVEPYVNRLYTYMAKRNLCVVVLDNVDLFEDEELETKVFAEGLAFSQITHSSVLISLRDTTFVRHQSDSTFNAYQLRKLWLNPPDFKSVLSNRLSY